MVTASFARTLMLVAGAALVAGCGPKVINESPPRSVTGVPTSPDAGLPAVPLQRGGVIVPRDVQLEPPPKESQAPSGSPIAPARPGGG